MYFPASELVRSSALLPSSGRSNPGIHAADTCDLTNAPPENVSLSAFAKKRTSLSLDESNPPEDRFL